MRSEGYCSLFGELCPLHRNLKKGKSRCESNDKNEQYGYLYQDRRVVSEKWFHSSLV